MVKGPHRPHMDGGSNRRQVLWGGGEDVIQSGSACAVCGIMRRRLCVGVQDAKVSHSPACIHLEMLASVRGTALVLQVSSIDAMALASVPKSKDLPAERLSSRMGRTASVTSDSVVRKCVLLACMGLVPPWGQYAAARLKRTWLSPRGRVPTAATTLPWACERKSVMSV